MGPEMDAWQLLSYIEQMQTLKYLDVATLALLTLEYVQTMPMEIRLVWPARLSYVKVLYFLNRHVVFVSVVAPRLVNSTRCNTMYILSNCGRVATVLISEALLFARVWALSGNEGTLGTCLFIFWLCTGTAAFALITIFAIMTVFILSPFPWIVTCIAVHTDPKYSVPGLVLILVEQIVIMIISLFLGIRKHARSGSHLGKTLFRDGLMYFVALTILALLNVAVQQTVQTNLRYALNTFHFALHSILCTRMVLHLRQESRARMGFTTYFEAGIMRTTADDSVPISLRPMR